MPDYRQELINSIERSMVGVLDQDALELVSGRIIRVLNDYEITKRCTDIAVYDDANERIIKRYCACMVIDGKSEKTINAYRRTIVKLVEFLQKSIPDIGVYDIRYYLACEKERGISNRSLENVRANLSAFFQWLTLEEIIPKNPCLNIRPVKYTDEIKKAFTKVEIDQLRSCCRDQRERALIEFLLATGVRVSELSGMNVNDIDLDKMSVHVKHGKGAKERITFINDVAVSHLRKYLLQRKETGEVLFYNKNHDRIKAGGIRMMLKGLEKRSGVTNVHPHRFRRTFATELANRGMKIQEIQKLLGHSTIQTTLTYVAVDDNKIQASYKQFIA